MPTFADALADGIVFLDGGLAREIEASRHGLRDDPHRRC
jgi:hypothetical protein